ncbi:MAG: 2,3-bisphosphoglycerate-independent phosphoglycerate mutase [Phycisphaerae bacterium]
MATAENRPCIVIIRDGWGENPYPEWDHANATKCANPAVDAMLRRDWPMTLIATSGEDVGLPEGTMGNSEVGHQNIGAGRIVYQDAVRISKGIREGTFFQNAELVSAVEHCRGSGGKLHIMGLASDAGVHSRLAHLYACVQLAAQRGLSRVFVHCFTDGRDSPPNSGIDYVAQIEAELKRIGCGRIASVCGRFYAMDRDNRWERTQRAYRLLVNGFGAAADSAKAALQRYYANPVEPTMQGDEFVEPTVISDDGRSPIATIDGGDAVIFYNFRGDRPRQLIKALTYEKFPFVAEDKTGETREMGFERGNNPDVPVTTMTAYEAGLPVHVAYPKPEKMKNIAGAYVSNLDLRQYRAAETEKYAHVTFFFNDYREEPFPGEERKLVHSPKVSTYDQQPEMSAEELTDAVVERIGTKTDDLIILNYANPDMVGHTGSLEAATAAVNTVDECVGRVLRAIDEVGGCAIVTADHGNCEQMIDPVTNGPHTSHTTYPVPLFVYGKPFRGARLRAGGRLADVMPTALAMLGLSIPAEMTGTSLIA